MRRAPIRDGRTEIAELLGEQDSPAVARYRPQPELAVAGLDGETADSSVTVGAIGQRRDCGLGRSRIDRD